MGKVYLVGAGPGDQELLTLKALRLIKSADVILYDRLINQEILLFAKPDCELVYVGKEAGKHTIEQEKINELLLKYAQTKDVVVRLKGGDPFIFGRGGEEALFLAEHRIDFEIVPGVSSFYSVPAYAGIPLTFRGISSSFAVITGHEDTRKESSSIDWNSLKGINTLVFLMGVSRRKEIAKRLIEIGRSPDEPVAFIENGTTERQRVILTSLYELSTDPPKVNPPAVMVVGSVVTLREYMNQFSKEVKVCFQHPMVERL
ncbi:uroporphyrinogen-III C-methyltransferase [Pampinifervens florentissimum]|uniref:uroporphyrinogen-III C-methyltransferase n=1 Tax=Pampinifervens florentissimum TaxID=1632019 RepID=UPI0013B48506|nr:uroporphyrinogen-III C-methyltransferase [Hydrogenobacter sp. T-8]QID32861.1 uroporphyrinogen-III C-methyltransferase [Hydrogenobacter sp. T-8]